MSQAAVVVQGGKEKKVGKKLFWRRGGFVSRFLRTRSTLSHLSNEQEAETPNRDKGSPCREPQPDPPSDGSSSPALTAPASPRTPGLSGLKNHGNTCFMNAVLQCLSNTDLFAEFLGLEQYNEGSPLPSPGTLDRGEVTEQLAKLLRSLWTLEYTPQHSRDFKRS